jgi:ABC-type uncharacterized transport system permease subunit
MTVELAPTDDVEGGEIVGNRWFQGRNLVILLSLAGMVVISFARIIADADRLTSSVTIGTGLRLTIPIALAGIGGLYAERSGTINIGLEGMITLGTVMAGWAGWHWGPWAAMLAGIIGGMMGGLLMSLATTTFGVNHIIAGFAINIIGPGVARFLANVWFTTEQARADGGSITGSPRVDGNLPRWTLPKLSDGPDLLGDLEDKGWFLLSDVAGIIRGLTVDVRLDSVLAILLIIGSAYVIWKTPFGLRLRSAGEKPGAAESLGVSVLLMRHVGLAISGAFAGLAGAVLVFAGSSQYAENQVAGRGFLGLAALVFGNWMPAGVLAGSAVFGYSQSVAISLDSGISVRGLILATAIALVLFAIRAVIQRSYRVAAIEVVVAAAAFVAFALVDEVNRQFVFVTPYVVTLVVVTIFAQRLRPPAAEGIPYFKGQSL